MRWINQMEPSFDDKEREALDEYMRQGGWGTEFKKTRQFEDMIAHFTGAGYCWAMPNGTLSLSCALVAVGVKPGDEVIVPDFTMAATPNAVHLIGAKAIFADVERKSLCMDFEKMKTCVTQHTKAIILVSLNGRYPQNINDYIAFCRENGIKLIEDAAQALGSFYNGKHVGTYGEIGSFSFSAPKIITTGQGGALITDDEEIAERIKRLRDFGRESGGSDHYLTMGWNLKFSDFQAVIGIEQMKKLDDRIKRKKEMGRLYEEFLGDLPEVEIIPTNYEETPPWFFDILCEDRSGLITYLKENNIGSRPFYPPLHSEPVYGYNLTFPVTEEISAKGLWLPSSMQVTNDEIKYICGCIHEYYKRVRK